MALVFFEKVENILLGALFGVFFWVVGGGAKSVFFRGVALQANG